MTEPSRLEQEVAGIRAALTNLLTNDIPHLKAQGKLHTTLILGIYGAINSCPR